MSMNVVRNEEEQEVIVSKQEERLISSSLKKDSCDLRDGPNEDRTTLV